MSLKYSIVSLFLITSLFLTGCAQKVDVTESSEDSQKTAQEQQRNQFMQGDPATMDDVVIGTSVVVMGTDVGDGSIVAEHVRIGTFEPPMGFADGQGPQMEGVDGEMPAPPEGFGPAGDFQNMTPEERQQRFQEMRDNGQIPEGFGQRGGFGNRGTTNTDNTFKQPSTSIVRGEVVEKDDMSITVKISETAGTKLVLYTDDTVVVTAIPPQENQEDSNE